MASGVGVVDFSLYAPTRDTQRIFKLNGLRVFADKFLRQPARNVRSEFAVVLVKAYFLSESGEEVTSTPTVSSLDISWYKNGQTLILVLAKNCRFCTESAPFYRRLSQSKGDTHLVALLPQPVEEGRDYLEKLGVSVDEVKQFSLEKIGISGTPTLLLVDTSGAVKNFWVGKLSPEQETTVLSMLSKG